MAELEPQPAQRRFEIRIRPDDVFQERLYCVRWRLPRLDELLWAEQRLPSAGTPLPEWGPLERASELQRAALTIPHWRTDAEAARLVAGAVENDHV